MQSRWRTRRCFGAGLLLLACTGMVPAQKIKVEYDKSQAFSQYKTYSWLQQQSYTRVFLALNIVSAIDQELQAKGLRKADSGGDLMVTAYGAFDDDISVAASSTIYQFPALYGPTWASAPTIRGGTSAVYIRKGTLVVDVVEAASRQLKWRGIATAKFDLEKKMQALDLVNKSVEKMFRQYPVRN